ncbi:MAG: ATP-binding protein [candidate division Zixibacteria bacterium]|nr:ATP-binding protein [Candidatus Tariuqbacter arcticus]
MSLFDEKKAFSGNKNDFDNQVENGNAVEISIDDEYSIYPILKTAEKFCKAVGLNTIQSKETEIALKELVTNVLKHGGAKGLVRFSRQNQGNASLIIEVEDWGSGLKNFHQALEDGYTSGGGLGGGLPAVNRLMDSFKLISRTNGGALFRTVKHASNNVEITENEWRFSVYSRPEESENLNGDGYFLKRSGNSICIAIIDGLGHGSKAHEATQKALYYIEQFHQWEEVELFNLLHEKLNESRGIAIGLVKIQEGTDVVRYTGIGNITGLIQGKKSIGFINYSGTIGVRVRKIRTLEYKVKPDDLLILHSDGITTNWMNEFNNIWRNNLQSFTQELISKYGRKNDDATIIAGWRK